MSVWLRDPRIKKLTKGGFLLNLDLVWGSLMVAHPGLEPGTLQLSPTELVDHNGARPRKASCPSRSGSILFQRRVTREGWRRRPESNRHFTWLRRITSGNMANPEGGLCLLSAGRLRIPMARTGSVPRWWRMTESNRPPVSEVITPRATQLRRIAGLSRLSCVADFRIATVFTLRRSRSFPAVKRIEK